jgi:hypothetical protein
LSTFIGDSIFTRAPPTYRSPLQSNYYFHRPLIFSYFFKKIRTIHVKYSPVKKQNNKYNNVFVRGYKFGLMTLEFKKFSDQNEDAYYKDFLDLLDTDPKVGNDLGIIKVAFVRDSSKCSNSKIQSSGYKACHFLGIAPQESENDN